jgi:hypothetical protein
VFSLGCTPDTDVEVFQSDDHYYQIQLERSRAYADKETLEKVYQQLLEEHRKLQTNFVSDYLVVSIGIELIIDGFTGRYHCRERRDQFPFTRLATAAR